jgi:hypothetical protein
MSLADFRSHFARRRAPKGLVPPASTPAAILDDLRWQWALYREDGLPLRDRLAFVGLRVIQRVAYNIGWFVGGRD